MKAFRFRLDQALRWRVAQVNLEKTKLAAEVAKLATIRAERAKRERLLAESAAELAADPTGNPLHSWAAWKSRCTREIAGLDQLAIAAEQSLAAAMQRLVEANRNVELLDKLKQAGRSKWQAESDRELEAFAGETFLRQATIKKRTGA